MIGALREWIYSSGILKHVSMPSFVVSVGNISMGGTGKSPFVMHLAEWAVVEGFRVAVLSRGYKRKSGSLKIVRSNAPLPSADEVGDEPWMIRNRVPNASLLVHKDRARMAKRHWQELGDPEIVLLDDAFQHWRAIRDRDVVMVDASESLDQAPLPFGRLREGVEAIARADMVVITRAGRLETEALNHLMDRMRRIGLQRKRATWKRSQASAFRVIAVDYEFDSVCDAQTQEKCQLPADRNFLLVSGVAKPDGVRALVRSLNLPVAEELYFPDHHRFQPHEWKRVLESVALLKNGAILTTEKDWARWRELFAGKVDAYFLRVKFGFFGNSAEELRGFLQEISQEIRKCSISRS